MVGVGVIVSVGVYPPPKKGGGRGSEYLPRSIPPWRLISDANVIITIRRAYRDNRIGVAKSSPIESWGDILEAVICNHLQF